MKQHWCPAGKHLYTCDAENCRLLDARDCGGCDPLERKPHSGRELNRLTTEQYMERLIKERHDKASNGQR